MEVLIGERYGLRYAFVIIPYSPQTYRIFSKRIKINILKKFSRRFVEKNFRPWEIELYKSTEEAIKSIEELGGVKIIKRVEWK